MRHDVIGGEGHSKHARSLEALGFWTYAGAQNATLQFGGCEVHQNSHTGSILAKALRVKDVPQG
jgi:hypothetical protein